MGKQGGRKRHVPQRTCVGCRQTTGKRSLIRLVRTPAGVQVDLTGKLAGRGAYVHDDPDCWRAALAGPMANALRTSIDAEEKDRLMEALVAHHDSHPDG
jgi:predicted RNA-binding protein YlxR (DUF448 family)